MTIQYLLDTNIASYAIKERSLSVQAEMERRGRGQILISAITEVELLYGLEDLPADHLLQTRVRRFLSEFPPVPWGDKAPAIFASLKRRLEREGRAIEDFDLMIAAHAMSLGAVLITNNVRHFERVGPELKIENWHQD